jgi:MinD superfamily P-loop ATPase
MIVSIASGKGGTGKTTVATNLAVSVSGPVQLLDCDVEEPNAHLFLRPVIEETTTVTTPIPEIDLEKCNQCKKCAEICRFQAIAVLGDTVLTFPELCHSCGGCMAVCPEGAITEKGRELGVLETGAMNGYLLFGLFGVKKYVRGKIKSLDFIDAHTVLLEQTK